MATLTDSDHGNLQPVCQNCSTSTTPLWRRDEIGSVLCNACGLFLKLHGRNRPLALKTDVIKSRNRVKSAGPSQKKKVSGPFIEITCSSLPVVLSLFLMGMGTRPHTPKLDLLLYLTVESRTKALPVTPTIPTLQFLALQHPSSTLQT